MGESGAPLEILRRTLGEAPPLADPGGGGRGALEATGQFLEARTLRVELAHLLHL